MPKFSQRSQERLSTCHPDLQKIMNTAIQHFDFTVLEGQRTLEKQRQYLKEGKSKTLKSKHLLNPSRAVDIAPYPIDWEDIKRFKELAWLIKGIAKELQIEIIHGGDWKTFKDYPHFELV